MSSARRVIFKNPIKFASFIFSFYTISMRYSSQQLPDPGKLEHEEGSQAPLLFFLLPATTTPIARMTMAHPAHPQA